MRKLWHISFLIILYSCNGEPNSKSGIDTQKDVDCKNGKVEEFYPSGKVFKIEYYKDCKKDSVSEEYFENGKLKSMGVWVNGKEFSNKYVYAPEGNVLQHYFYSLDGLIYFKDYEKKHIDNSKTLFLYYNKGNFKKGEELEVLIFLAKPEVSEINLEMEIKVGNNVIRHKKFKESEINNILYNSYVYRQKLDSSATYDFVFHYKMKDLTDDSLIQDTSGVRISVR